MVSENYFVNHPVFLKYKRHFDWKAFRKKSFLKRVVVNERIIEIPFTIKALTAIHDGGKVLDLGCMESTLPLFMAGLGFQVTGFDFREYPYVMPNFEFVKGDILKLPFADDTYDAVTCVSTLEHIGIGFYDDPQNSAQPDFLAMTQIRRVLRPGGLLVLSVPFGQFHVNHQQRVYDHARLTQLLESFSVLTMDYYQNMHNASANNYWKKIPLNVATEISYAQGTECVCCVTARKKA
ncbi:MAG TPA: class I SAM-dependent methyltransferase [Candidatus Bathyarchaeia archaeon]|nr:class I SAM-dependent methyltransferase [Candidatus Bathyarchaeia archaeon]